MFLGTFLVKNRINPNLHQIHINIKKYKCKYIFFFFRYKSTVFSAPDAGGGWKLLIQGGLWPKGMPVVPSYRPASVSACFDP